jgi:hypothetical protein
MAAPNLNNVLANPAPAPPLETQDQQNQPDEMNVFQPAGGVAGPPLPEIFRYGPIQLHPSADYSFSYGDGIQSAPGAEQSTAVQQLALGLRVDLGEHWALQYAPAFQFYSSDQFHNSVSQFFGLTGGFSYEDWRFGLSQGYQYSSAPTVATGSQTDQSSYTTSLTASHPFTSKVSGDFSLGQSIALNSGLENSYDWSTMEWVNYLYGPRLNAGLGVGAGYVEVEDNSQAAGLNNGNQTFEQLQARVNWRANEKISFQISGGVQDTQFASGGTGDSLSPIFGAAIQYQPRIGTQISVTAGRSVSSSDLYLAAQQVESTSVGLNLNQVLFRNFTLGLGVGYGVTDYGSAANGANANAADRSDDQVSFSARLSHPFLKRGSWSVFYQYSDNSSSVAGYTFASNQMGFEIGYRF